MNQQRIISIALGSILAVGALSLPAVAQGPAPSDPPGTVHGDGADVAALYELQAAFHRAASVHDPVHGDDQDVIDSRVRDMMALWTPDGSLTLMVGGKNDGRYEGTGDPSDAATCPEVSGSVGGPRGTLCTLFKYVAGSFQQADRFISLAPSYLTAFTVRSWCEAIVAVVPPCEATADVYFQCHYFNVATDPWTVASHLVFDGTAMKAGGRWRFSHADGPVAADIPVPGQTPAPLPSAQAAAMSDVIANC